MPPPPRRTVPVLALAALALAACEQPDVDPQRGADVEDVQIEQNWEDIEPGDGGEPQDVQEEDAF